MRLRHDALMNSSVKEARIHDKLFVWSCSPSSVEIARFGLEQAGGFLVDDHGGVVVKLQG